jgi:hypothetical protein
VSPVGTSCDFRQDILQVKRGPVMFGLGFPRETDELMAVVVVHNGESAEPGHRFPETQSGGNRTGRTFHWLSVTTQEASPPAKI